MDVRLPAQLRRPLQVSGPVRFVPQIGQAAPVDPLGPARPLERPVRRLLPRLTGLLQPVPGLGRPRLPRPALFRGLRVVALEPLLPAALDPVIASLGEHQVRVGIFSVRPAPVDRQRIGQPLPARQPLGEARGSLPPLGLAELLGKRELDLAVQPSVGALVLVRRLPVFFGVVPLSLASNDSGSVLAVKGTLRRFAPWTAVGRSGETRCSRGKKGGPCGRAEREPFGHTRTP